ncbi:MAG TPA: M24 family metallopeptidase [Dokdonella sp.]|uniref:M24 family metallopeptidase n=1 Tax=Dokdonella sp. TaxID=2291710 RepID=UPI002D7FF46D|nr:M24 family metallopeptidase [Dokdonella sp.]HET9032913.1 M24 family metallopeptidase [Dokdonella sp.]
MKILLFCFALFAAIPSLQASEILPVREQARVVDEILAERLDTVLPALMQANDIDMWIIVSREYNEDPVLRTMLPATWLNARRRTILVFNRGADGKFEKLAVARYNVGDRITAAWDMQRFPKQWDALADIVSSRDPNKIAIDTSADFAHADGLVKTDYDELMQALPKRFRSRIVSAEDLAVGWLETRTAREMQIYPQLVRITHGIIAEAFSAKVITPGITTSDDVVWWLRQRVSDLGLETWFHPSVSIQRNDGESFDHLKSFIDHPAGEIIRQGDLLHVDFGITYLRLNTDVQEHAYVLRPGETDVPDGIAKAMLKANRLQDILTSQFALGKTGNQILADALAEAKKEGIKATIYTHPLGCHGHAAGPTIGMWDQQGGVAGSGDFPMHANTVYSIELNAASDIAEWKKEIRIMLEQDGSFDGKAFRYLDGRQKAIHLIPRPH